MNKLYLRQGHFLQGFAVIILCEVVKEQSQITYGYVSEEEDGGMSGDAFIPSCVHPVPIYLTPLQGTKPNAP